MVVSKYQKRISGPLLDRIDIHVEVPRVEYEKLSESRLGESSATVRERVEAARWRQQERFTNTELRMNEYPFIEFRFLQRGYAPGGAAQVLRAG